MGLYMNVRRSIPGLMFALPLIMRPMIFLGFCLVPVLLLAQNEILSDTAVLHQQIREFAPLVTDRAAAIDKATEIDSIQAFAHDLEERSAHLLNEIQEAYPIDEELLLERDLINASQLDLEPDLAADHLRRSHAAQEQIDATMPGYFAALRKINELSRRIGSARRAERARQWNEELKEVELYGKESVEPDQ